MNKKLITFAAGLLILFTSSSSWALFIDSGMMSGTNVGSIDTFIAQGPQQGNPSAETTWADPFIPGTATYVTKDAPVIAYSTNQANVIAFALSSMTDYFLIKKKNSIALFENTASLDWGVINLNDFSAGLFNLKDPMRGIEISHVTLLNGDKPPVGIPEPGTLGLLALGLVGLRAARKKLSS